MLILIFLLRKLKQIKNINKVVAINNVFEITNVWMHFAPSKELNNINTLSLILLIKIRKVHLVFYMCFQEHGQLIDMKHL